MGKVKLTLTVDQRIVARAKLLAKEQRKSLSMMIEELLTASAISLPEAVPTVPAALRLRGIARSGLSQKTDKQIREMMYKDRYGL